MTQAFQNFVAQLPAAPCLRFVLPALALWILLRCARALLTFRREPEVWAWLTTPTGHRLPVARVSDAL